MTLLKAELSLLSTGELTLCRSLEILSTIHNNIIKLGGCFFPRVLLGPLNLMGGTGLPTLH